MSTETILLPLDGSAHSKYACEVAYRLAARLPGKETMHLLHCVTPIPGLIGGEQRAQLEKEHAEEAAKIFAPCIELFAKLGNPCVTHVLYGEPGHTIAAAAKDFGCTLIVMGCRGHSDLQNLVMGSASSHVLQHSTVPVLIAKPCK
ncbi:universal stress protein [Desulfovibrio sp. OttesenSCG-928-C06]|nr:universal stress protein [Desulfovibrio sp. OttesenSCG-928-C06]